MTIEINSVELSINDIDYENKKLIFTSTHETSYES